jgi:hypothetical protein
MLKTIYFIQLLGGAIMAKNKYSANIQFYIDYSALKIFNKERTIEQIFKKFQSDVLEICKNDYNCDGYGQPLEKEVGQE